MLLSIGQEPFGKATWALVLGLADGIRPEPLLRINISSQTSSRSGIILTVRHQACFHFEAGLETSCL
jgi:hypothetical protein